MELYFSTVVLVALTTSTFATTVSFKNNCPNDVSLIKTVNEKPPVEECQLASGASCSKTYDNAGIPDGQGMNFKTGQEGKTLAEITFQNKDGQDHYDLSVIVGYDTAMQISNDQGGPTVTCKDAQCPDAYLFSSDDTKDHGIPTGGTFEVVLCP